MANLSFPEKMTLERLFEMQGGYVLDFNNRSFAAFFGDAIQVDIYAQKYAGGGESKANRMRTFWSVEPDHVVARLLGALVDHMEQGRPRDLELLKRGRAIVDRLKASAPVADIDAISPKDTGKEFELLVKAVRESLAANEPELGVDRLHTFIVKYIRVLSRREGISIDREKPLHSIFGELLKVLRARGRIESQMADRILKSTISILEAFNDVRNDKSLAHDNKLISYQEALLIFNNVSSMVRFLDSVVTAKEAQVANDEAKDYDDDVPF